MRDNPKEENPLRRQSQDKNFGEEFFLKKKTSEPQDDRYPDGSIPQSERSQGTPPIIGITASIPHTELSQTWYPNCLEF